ncbi:MAG: hypothetical protein R2747_23365 [Pyrinomonadaceae bacterium]
MENETNPNGQNLEEEDRKKAIKKLQFEKAVNQIYTLTNLKKTQIESALKNLSQFQINLVRDAFIWRDFEEAQKFAYLNFSLSELFKKREKSYRRQLNDAESVYNHLKAIDEINTRELEEREE